MFTDIADSAQFGHDTKVWNFTVIGEDVRTGDQCVIGSHCYIGKGTVMGDGVRIQTGVFLPNHTVIGSRVFIGPNVTVTDDKHPKAGQPYEAQPPVIHDDVSIGAGSVLLPGIVLGRGAVVGAGAVVTQDVPPGMTVVGCPARELTHNSEGA